MKTIEPFQSLKKRLYFIKKFYSPKSPSTYHTPTTLDLPPLFDMVGTNKATIAVFQFRGEFDQSSVF